MTPASPTTASTQDLRVDQALTQLASLLPNARQAQCWQQFVELYSTLSREAEDDFQDLFGREFGRAYEQHIARQRRP